MRAKFVNEDFRDILKPKSIDDIKKDHQSLIFWKRVIDGARSPNSMKYFLDKKFIQERAKEHGFHQPIKKDWQKQLIYFCDVINDEKTKKNDEITKGLFKITLFNIKNYDGKSHMEAPAAFYMSIKNFINNQYNIINNTYKKYTGNELKEEFIGDYHWRDRQGKSHITEVYKNPKNITRLDPDIRGKRR